ncbi:MarR family transcriptional regulator [Paracidovorax wautersii]|uniref:DNA-binding MarR family transcriptional regulator n=1 Tax=Paracidovorax wautersii TaxID=1177982 RepID=A0ABU1I585_9BURK|nr:MarR family transcriptional regulator [Paracidovorax wautersii]MDR6212385.1 DNA-binding MarR family transcriptional regulator [Paracidovorax wautersii]
MVRISGSESAPPGRRPTSRSRKAAASHDFQSDALGYKLRLAQVRAFDLFFEKMAPMDLSPARVTALSLIAMNTGINQAALAKELGVAGPSVLKLVDALEGAGWIRRVEVEGDRRRYSLEITEQGEERLGEVRDKLAEYEVRLSKGLSADERETLMDLLDRVAR